MRYRCLECGKSFVTKRRAKIKAVKKKNILGTWFIRYVLNGLTYQTISETTGTSIRSLESDFHSRLEAKPPDLRVTSKITLEKDRPIYLLIDGKWQGKTKVDMFYRRTDLKTIIHHSFLKREYASQIERDLVYIIKELEYTNIQAVISDGGPGITKAVLKVFGHIPHQICLAHISRELTRCLGKYPTHDGVAILKSLVLHMWLIESREALDWWFDKVKLWARINADYLREVTINTDGRWHYTHPKVRKALRVMLKAYKHSFVFLDYPLVPKTSNHIEASIGVINRKRKIHTGLKDHRHSKFINWSICVISCVYSQVILTAPIIP